MKILIGITSKNRASILPKAINSALTQSYSNKEVWVFDDASTDNTRALAKEFPMVNWIFSDEPKGLVWARNMFMSQEGFDYFCSLDDDAWFIKDEAIEVALKQLQENSLTGALGFDMLSPDNPDGEQKEPLLVNSNNFIGCGHIINLKAAKKINFYTLNPGFYGGEEKDFCIRLINAGFEVKTLKHMYVWHDKTSIARDLPRQHRSGVCNDLVFTYRRTPLLYLIPSIVIKLYKHLKFSINFGKVPLTKACLQGFKDFFIWLLYKKTNRKPVSTKAFKKFLALSN